MKIRILLLTIGLAGGALYAQEKPKGEPKQLHYTYSKDGSLQSRLQKEIKHRKSSIYVEDTEEFLVYPNPADEFIIVDLKDFEGSKEYQLLNNLGKIIKQGHLTDQITELNFSDLPQGIYFFNLIQSDNKTNSTQKIIKN